MHGSVIADSVARGGLASEGRRTKNISKEHIQDTGCLGLGETAEELEHEAEGSACNGMGDMMIR